MNSFPYSPPELPVRRVIADMVVFYATPELRRRLMTVWPDEAELLEDLVEQVMDLVATWNPTTDWHLMSVVRQGRTLEWLVWQVAMNADQDFGEGYRVDAIIPWAIDLDTLPRYNRPPTMLVRPDDD